MVSYFPLLRSDTAELRVTEIPLLEPLPKTSEWRLTGREQEILRWISQGKRDAEIGVILGIATKTVSKHLESILAKLGVPSRTAALTLMLEGPDRRAPA